VASEVEVCNRGLQLLGAESIISLTENSNNARRCLLAYTPVRLAFLRKHTWSCAITRAALLADAVAPVFGRARAFALPADYIRLMPPYAEDNPNDLDWQIEGKKIYTDDSAPLQIRYIFDLKDVNTMDALFREALAHTIALNICESVTNSSSKKRDIAVGLADVLADAKRVNAMERPSQIPPEDTWVTVRA